MPRITAPTVTEHRDQRRADLVAAGQELLVTEGPDAVTMTAVAARAGLSRTAVYEYFTSADELLAVVLSDQMVLWREALRQRLHAASFETGDLDTVRIYVEVAMGLVADGHHSLLVLLTMHTLAKDVRHRLSAAHAAVAAPVGEALARIGIRDVDQATNYVHAAIEAAARRLTPGQDARAEIAAVAAFTVAGVRALAATSSQS
ncbi:MAG: TetR/AcrR family transcriptional regulator [Actinomycetota bacterium]|nr:TetR/AcrR family transcriptional regulator [Actinomycetota bacterium]MEC8406698.1 TetR/AcrR family transcriptional regulator [Actinomycetota bacterium]MEC8647801.1 TetR/AcrR family transcriptional regulator [Actinomycetota bacterium]MED6330626.1 TetR/AcrR family transcriptional regulator [Actinomycetota bacterium]